MKKTNANPVLQSKGEKTPIIQYNTSMELIAEYDSIRSAAKQFGGKMSNQVNICACVAGRLKTAYGYIWRLKHGR